MADPEGGEFCAFVREGEIARRLYEIGVDTGPSAADSHRIAAWWAEVLGGRAVDDERGYSWVEDIARPRLRDDRLRAGARAEDRRRTGSTST